MTIEAFVQERGKLLVLRGPSTYHRPPALLINPEETDDQTVELYRSTRPVHTAREGVAVLPDVTIWDYGIIKLDDGRILAESVEGNGPLQTPPPTDPPTRRLTKAVYAGKQGNGNYGHFLVEILPRLGLNRSAWPDGVRILLHKQSRPFAAPVIEAAGLDWGRIGWTRHAGVQVRKLYWPTRNTAAPLRFSPHIVPYLRGLAGPPASERVGRRVFVGRKDARTRQLLNEQAVLEVLEPLGFESVAPGTMTFSEQMRVFGEADLVVGVCGAALTNMVFMPPGGTVIMLTPSQMAGLFFWDLASQSQLQLEVLWGRSVEPISDRAAMLKHDDFTVDIDRLVDAVRRPRPSPTEVGAVLTEAWWSTTTATVLPDPTTVGASP